MGHTEQSETLRFLVWQEGASWVAVEVDYLLSAQADNFEDLGYQIEHAIVGHIRCSEIEGLVPFTSIRREDSTYRKMFESASEFKMKVPRFDDPGLDQVFPTPPRIETRQFAYAT